LKRQLSVPEIRKGLSEKAVRSGGAYLQGDMGRRDKPLYRQDLAKIGRGQLPFQGLSPRHPKAALRARTSGREAQPEAGEPREASWGACASRRFFTCPTLSASRSLLLHSHS
jgi:hypothetical protein